MTAVDTKELTKCYKGKTVVNRLNLKVNKGEIYALLGVNGAGKSTTIKMLSCLIKPTSGDATLLGESIVSSADKVKSIISVSPQETSVAPNLTVRENIEFIAKIFGLSNQTAQRKTEEIIRAFDLSEIEKARAKTLSGGWQRRLSIAMALVSEPKVIFLDEPTLGLDVLARRELWKHIEKLRGDVTVILTTHYLEEAQSLADRIGIMSKGTLKAEGTAEELIRLSGQSSFENAFITLAQEA